MGLMMQQVNSLSLMKVQEATDLSQARSEVVLDGNNTGAGCRRNEVGMLW